LKTDLDLDNAQQADVLEGHYISEKRFLHWSAGVPTGLPEASSPRLTRWFFTPEKWRT
jgi:hypothetical protein